MATIRLTVYMVQVGDLVYEDTSMNRRDRVKRAALKAHKQGKGPAVVLRGSEARDLERGYGGTFPALSRWVEAG